MAIQFSRQQGTAVGGNGGVQSYDTIILSIVGDGASTSFHFHLSKAPFLQLFSSENNFTSCVVTFTSLGVVTTTVSGDLVTLTFSVAPPVPSSGPFSGQVNLQLMYTGV